MSKAHSKISTIHADFFLLKIKILGELPVPRLLVDRKRKYFLQMAAPTQVDLTFPVLLQMKSQ